jgi:hypothetical protein
MSFDGFPYAIERRYFTGTVPVKLGSAFLPPGSYRVTAFMGRIGDSGTITLQVRTAKTDTVLSTLQTSAPVQTVGPTTAGDVVISTTNGAIEFWGYCSNNTTKGNIEALGLTSL